MPPELKLTDKTGTTMKYAGVPIFMDGKEWIVPPLSVKQLRTYEEKIRTLGDVTPEQALARLPDIVEVIHAALSRNYSDVTPDKLEDMLDVATMREAMEAITTVSGFKRVRVGEKEPAAESTGPGLSVQ